MHRRPASETKPQEPFGDEFIYPPALGTYMECLKRIYVLNFGSLSKGRVRQAEDDLRKHFNQFVKKNRLSVQNFLGEWRIFVGSVPENFLGAVDAWVCCEFNDLGVQYCIEKSGT